MPVPEQASQYHPADGPNDAKKALQEAYRTAVGAGATRVDPNYSSESVLHTTDGSGPISVSEDAAFRGVRYEATVRREGEHTDTTYTAKYNSLGMAPHTKLGPDTYTTTSIKRVDQETGQEYNFKTKRPRVAAAVGEYAAMKALQTANNKSLAA